jgi:anti-sigma-K factor RskA
MTDEDRALAGEFVLRLLGPAEEAQARARMATDRAFADEVAAWEERLQPLHDGAEEAPSDLVWQRISAQIDAPVVQDNRPSGLRFWQGLSALATVAALFMGVMLFNRAPEPAAAPAPLIAALASDEGPTALTASYDPQSGKLTLTPVSMDTGKLYPELWVIPAGGEARSLGLVVRERPTQVSVTPDLRAIMAKGATLAITPEPAGGAPGGKATGPVIASGKITTI